MEIINMYIQAILVTAILLGVITGFMTWVTVTADGFFKLRVSLFSREVKLKKGEKEPKRWGEAAMRYGWNNDTDYVTYNESTKTFSILKNGKRFWMGGVL